MGCLQNDCGRAGGHPTNWVVWGRGELVAAGIADAGILRASEMAATEALKGGSESVLMAALSASLENAVLMVDYSVRW